MDVAIAVGTSSLQVVERAPIARCKACGQIGRMGARFCWSCGESFSIAAQYAPPVTCMFAARTDRGRVRDQNEDTVYAGMLALPNGETAYVGMVADGMGGEQAGEQASWIAAAITWTQLQEALGHQILSHDADYQALLCDIVSITNRRVYDSSRTYSAWHGMGTTLTVALVVAGRAHVVSVGDSRAYRIAADDARARQLTTDHTIGARLLELGYITPEQVRDHPQYHALYRSLGEKTSVQVDTCSVQLSSGDRLLLCSDGLISHITDHELARIVLAHPNPACVCEQLVALANARGGEDNVSLVVMQTEPGYV